MNPQTIRAASLAQAKKLGYEQALTLPLLDEPGTLRDPKEVVSRALCLLPVVAASYGFPKDKASLWLKKEGLSTFLSPNERLFLENGTTSVTFFKDQVESLCAFAWALSFLPVLDFSRDAPKNLVTLFPDLKQEQAARSFSEQARLRSSEEITRVCDLSYCLHWATRQASLEGKPRKAHVPPYVIVERRRALEWMLANEEWTKCRLIRRRRLDFAHAMLGLGRCAPAASPPGLCCPPKTRLKEQGAISAPCLYAHQSTLRSFAPKGFTHAACEGAKALMAANTQQVHFSRTWLRIASSASMSSR